MACSYLNFCKYFLHFELLVDNTIKNETRKKFTNLLGISLVKYSSKFLAHIKKHLGHTGTPMVESIGEGEVVFVHI